MEILDIALSCINFLTNREKILLKKNIDSLDKLALLSIEEISSIIGRTVKSQWNGSFLRSVVEKSASIMESKQIEGAVLGTEKYPAMLSTINDPPYAFFYRGNLGVLKKKCVSVVGTRRICQESAVAALDFSREAAKDGRSIISGLANGIDTFAHRGALEADVESSTAAVLPCGIDTIVPYGNRSLGLAILKNDGLLCSEYIPGTPAERWRFVQRNRIIAALSSATVVIQAPKGSGALITADFALTYNRDLMFHKVGFCCQSVEQKADKGRKKTPSSIDYVEAGAPLIENYTDYLKVLENPPGTFSANDKQLELF